MSSEKYMVVRRRFNAESGSEKHEALLYNNSIPGIRRMIKSYKHHEFGDILFVCDVAGVSNIPEEAKCVYVVGDLGIPVAPKTDQWAYIPYKSTWVEAWEGQQASAYLMISQACYLDVDYKKIILALCYAARASCDYMDSQRKHETLKMVEDIELWCYGKLKDKDVFSYINRGWGIALPRLIRSAMFKSPSNPQASITEIAAEIYGRTFSPTMDRTEALELLAGPVREAITLRDVLLAAASK